jgi:hypothetical protein
MMRRCPTKRLPLAAGLLTLLGLASIASVAQARSRFDVASASLELPKDAVRAWDFEAPESLVGVDLATWDKTSGFPAVTRVPIATGADVAPLLTNGPDDAVQGAHALRLGLNATGLMIHDAPLFDALKDSRFEATLWTRGDGSSLTMQIIYDQDPENLYAGKAAFATVRAIRTGRATTDGWAEYSTGPIDGNVWGVPVRGLAILPSYYAADTDTFLVDALDISKVDGAPTAPLACTQQNVDAVCGAQGDCMFGHCVSSSVTWGALPPLAHRREIAERWILYGTRMIGDRNGATHGLDILTPGARTLAETSVSSRQFFGGMNRLVNLLRDNHTSFGSPSNFTSFAPQLQYGSSSALGACFGVVEKDLLGGGLGYAVFRAAASPITGVPLQRGDVLFAIDGRAPKEWVDDNWARFATTLPNDPASDWGPSANDLGRLISLRASTVTLLRCASSSSCAPGAGQQSITIDVGAALFKALTGPDTVSTNSFGCSQRFTNSVSTLASGGSGEDAVSVETGGGGETRVQFDGFVGQTTWPAAMQSVFNARPAKVLMDARMGHGGYFETVQTLFNLLRGPSEPAGVLSFGRGTYDLTDPPWLFDRLTDCSNARADQWTCLQGNAIGFFAKNTDPPGAATRIAWLNTYDVSANDFMPRLLQGRSNFKIFAPHPTSGAFGAISELPGIASGWSGGSLQVQDSRFAANSAAAATTRWESGHGVPPDVVVAEKLSDAIAGVDTILQAATTWLATP